MFLFLSPALPSLSVYFVSTHDLNLSGFSSNVRIRAFSILFAILKALVPSDLHEQDRASMRCKALRSFPLVINATSLTSYNDFRENNRYAITDVFKEREDKQAILQKKRYCYVSSVFYNSYSNNSSFL